MTPSSPLSSTSTTTSGGGDAAGKSGRTTSGPQPQTYPVVNYVAIAREITAQPWADVGLPLSSRAAGTASTTHHRAPGTENDDSPPATTNGDEGASSVVTSRATIVDRLVALLVVRIVALVASRRPHREEEQPVLDRARSAPACVSGAALNAANPLVNNRHNYGTGTATGEGGHHHPNAAESTTPNLDFDGACPTSDRLPPDISPVVLDQLRSFVSYIASHYRDVRYHSLEHGYHVAACANCLLDMLLRAGGEEEDGDEDDIDEEDEGKEEGIDDDEAFRRRRHRQQLQNFAATTTNEEGDNETGGQHNRSPAAALNPRPSGRRGSRRCSTNTASSAVGIPSPDAYGLRNDPVAQLALIFSAVIHDVDHRGITNQQLVREADELAIMYNDQSVAEQRSISLAFCELMRKRPPPQEAGGCDNAPPEYVYGALRAVLFGEDGGGVMRGDGAGDPPHSPPAAATTDGEDYVRFRRMVIDMVLSTDIASPERIQVGKSKYRAAFGPKRRGSHASSQMQQHGGQHRHQQGQGPASPRGPSPARAENHVPISSRGMATSQPADEAAVVDAVAAAAEEELMKIRGKTATSLGEDDDEADDLGASDPERKCSLREEFLNHRGSLNMSQLSSSFRRLSNVSSTTTSSESSDCRPTQCQHPAAVTENARGRSRSPTDSASDDGDPKAAALRDLRNHLPGSSEGSQRGGLGSKRSSRRGLMSSSEDSFRRRKGGGLASSDTHQRRFSAPAVSYPTREYRLGIRRALNLTGSTVSLFNSTTAKPGRDEEDELRANVVLELIIKAADIAPIMQGWENYNRWSRALFFEQKVAHEARRGPDPAPGWFDNQITFFDSYGMPLAKRLADVQVFGTRRSVQFARNILENRRRWLVEGRSRLADLILDWEEMKRRREASDGAEEAGAPSLSALHDFSSERN